MTGSCPSNYNQPVNSGQWTDDYDNCNDCEKWKQVSASKAHEEKGFLFRSASNDPSNHNQLVSLFYLCAYQVESCFNIYS